MSHYLAVERKNGARIVYVRQHGDIPERWILSEYPKIIQDKLAPYFETAIKIIKEKKLSENDLAIAAGIKEFIDPAHKSIGEAIHGDYFYNLTISELTNDKIVYWRNGVTKETGKKGIGYFEPDTSRFLESCYRDILGKPVLKAMPVKEECPINLFDGDTYIHCQMGALDGLVYHFAKDSRGHRVTYIYNSDNEFIRRIYAPRFFD